MADNNRKYYGYFNSGRAVYNNGQEYSYAVIEGALLGSVHEYGEGDKKHGNIGFLISGDDANAWDYLGRYEGDKEKYADKPVAKIINLTAWGDKAIEALNKVPNKATSSKGTPISQNILIVGRMSVYKESVQMTVTKVIHLYKRAELISHAGVALRKGNNGDTPLLTGLVVEVVKNNGLKQYEDGNQYLHLNVRFGEPLDRSLAFLEGKYDANAKYVGYRGTCFVRGKSATALAPYLDEGSVFLASGTVRTSEFTGDDGNPRVSYTFNPDFGSIKLLGKKEKTEDEAPETEEPEVTPAAEEEPAEAPKKRGRKPKAEKAAEPEPEFEMPIIDEIDDEIPF